ncbi:MAG: exodeoxyribonuclease V beta subunit [Paraglaciecola sp.]|jgi:exodeoxyribonuclease V beta subunit
MSSQSNTFQPLQVEALPLTGQHLIEASAGTGKTFNITRIYLRMLIEKKLTVQQILVMTFTRDATNELRGRIRKDIQNALNNWGAFPVEDEFFNEMQNRFSIAEINPILNSALLHMDESSIFTIHGFCNRVLTEQAFLSGIEFTLKMEADTQDIELEAVRDFYRRLAKLSSDSYQTIHGKWSSPELFYKAFSNVLSDKDELTSPDINAIIDDINNDKKSCLNELRNNKDAIFAALVDSHKDASNRRDEWDTLINWLSCEEMSPMPSKAKEFLHGGRYRKAQNKALVEVTLEFKSTYDSNLNQIINGKAYNIAHEAIVEIRLKIAGVKQSQQLMNFNDLINKLEECLLTDSTKVLANAIRTQFPVALVDEFQDTDPQQYNILKSIYQDHCNELSGNAIYMIGDPKQAIYGFRGGDIFAYLKARSNADYSWVMDTNWRSSQNMITAYNRLFYGRDLPVTEDLVGNDDVFGYGINYIPVKAPANQIKVLLDGNNTAAMQLAYFPYSEEYKPSRSKKEVNTAAFRKVISHWVANEIQRLLSTNTSIGEDAIQEQDIAILVRSGAEAKEIESALTELGYASVYLSNKDNLFNSVQAQELFTVLDGILDLEDNSKMLAALSTRYLGGTSELFSQIQTSESAWEDAQQEIKELRNLWEQRGFMAMALKFVHETYLPETNDHERAMTNTIHLLELLQQASVKHKQPRQLLHFLFSQIQIGTTQQEAELRLESDENLIKIVTQHGCKGLEYPIVFIPFATKYSDPTKIGQQLLDIHQYHDENEKSFKQIGQSPLGLTLAKEEGLAESIRLLYVAITRAVHRCYVCVTPFDQSELSPLGKTLKLKELDDLEPALLALADSEPDAISLIRVDEIEFERNKNSKNSNNCSIIEPELFHGHIERNWGISSFSALTRNVRHTNTISTPERQDDSSDTLHTDIVTLATKNAKLPLRFAIKKGADTGNLLHDILERTDFSHPNYYAACKSPLLRYSHFPDNYDVSELHDWMGDVLETKLTDIADTSGFYLKDITKPDTLKEVEFYFPMNETSSSALSHALAEHREEKPSNVLLNLPNKEKLQGMMHGFIDLICQWQGKYYVVDYKSTYLGDNLNDYTQHSMSKDIRDKGYDLQYLIYTLALHRFLKQRIPDYEPETHLGGVYYLYLRGMTQGSETGVYANKVSATLIDKLDGIFSGQY